MNSTFEDIRIQYRTDQSSAYATEFILCCNVAQNVEKKQPKERRAGGQRLLQSTRCRTSKASFYNDSVDF